MFGDRPDILIILCTGFSQAITAEAARELGMNAFLMKPLGSRDLAQAVRQVGAEEKTPVIDLNAMSLKFYAVLGPENSKNAFVFYPANTFPGQDKELKDRFGKAMSTIKMSRKPLPPLVYYC